MIFCLLLDAINYFIREVLPFQIGRVLMLFLLFLR